MKKLVLLLLVTLGLVLGSVPYEEGKNIEVENGTVESKETTYEGEGLSEEKEIEEPLPKEEEIKADLSEEDISEEEESTKDSSEIESTSVPATENRIKETSQVDENAHEVKTDTQNEPANAVEPAKPEEPCKQPKTEVSHQTYDPQSVVDKAIAKCKAGGMVTTTDNLAKLLDEGSISQEEYNEYYPYDGLGYYAVYVETDLNAASTTSGSRLGSVDAIANYIADMMLLESDPIFNVAYHGTVTHGGTEFYEFYCYR